MAQVAGEPVGEIVKLATDLGGGAAETEKVGELQPDDPKTNRRASRATYVFRQSPLSRAPRPFVGPVLKGRNGVDFTRSPSLRRMTGICAERSLQMT